MKRNVTINAIAEYAGVSRGTVDRVLNRRGNVNPRTEELVLQAMKELEYVPKKEEQIEALGLDYPELRNMKIGILLSNEQGYFRREVLRGIERARETLGVLPVEILVEECRTTLAEEVLEQMAHLKRQEISGLILNARNQRQIADAVNRFYDENIPIMTINTDISDCDRVAFIGQDAYQSGRIAGELMKKKVRPGDRIVICIGNKEFRAHGDRLRGFQDRLSECGFHTADMDILETYNDFEITFSKLKRYLKEHPDTIGIYMANRSVSACAEAVREFRNGTMAEQNDGRSEGVAGENPENNGRSEGVSGSAHGFCDISVIGHDLTEASRRLLKSGELEFIISQDLARQSYTALLSMFDYIKKGALAGTINADSDIGIYCAENCTEPGI